MHFRFSTKLASKIAQYSFFVCAVGSSFGQDSMVDREIARRQAAVQEGQIFLKKGDEAYEAGKFEEAATAYAGAVDSFPKAASTKELRAAAAQRYAQAAVEAGRSKTRKGDLAGAKDIVDGALTGNEASDHPAALGYRSELDDPIRTNPALTKEYGADVDEVRRNLYVAQGFYDLGKYDDSKEHYEKVLRLDPYNSAARRGMERIASQKSNYYGSSYDATRAELLSEVSAAWELPLATDIIIPENPGGLGLNSPENFIPVSQKLSRITIPEFQLEDATIMEALELIRLRAEENDTIALDPRRKGINITVNVGDATVSPGKDILAKTFDLNLKNVPLDQILNYVANITSTSVKKDEFAVTFVPLGFGAGELVTRTYRVPPDFLSNLSSSSSKQETSNDVFNTEIDSGGVLAERMGAQEALEMQGIAFPDGASASLNGATNTLRVVNSRPNQDVIQQIVDSIALTEPVSVAVRVTMIKVQKRQLEELGFDWMLNNFELGGSDVNLTGGTVGNGAALDDIAPAPGGGASTNPITSGNRSGDFALARNSIDELVAAGSSRGRQEVIRAPGVLGLNGVVDNATIQTLMRGINQKTGTDLMAQPAVTTRSGQAASILLVDEFLYPTEYEPPELPTTVGTATDGGGFPVTPATPTAFEKRDVGITLEVLPVADANKQYVDVTLNTSITDFDGFVNFGSPINATSTSFLGESRTQELTQNAILMPIFSPTRVNSNLIVADGATIVIGGLQKDEITTVNDKTPILGDIPLVGRLFQSDVNSHTSTAILFFVNVEILDPTGRPYRDR